MYLLSFMRVATPKSPPKGGDFVLSVNFFCLSSQEKGYRALPLNPLRLPTPGFFSGASYGALYPSFDLLAYVPAYVRR